MSRSLLQEQYEQAWETKRALERGMGNPAPEYIDVSNPNHPVCRCGNCPTSDGFTCEGGHIGPHGDVFDHSRCRRCGRLIVMPQGYVTEGPNHE